MRREFIDAQNRIIKKLITGVLVVNLTCTNFLYVGNYCVTYAVNAIEQNAEQTGELDKQTDATLSKNVKFDAYFAQNDKNTHYKIADVNTDEVSIDLNLKVKGQGYLKNAYIAMATEDGETPLNYKLISVTDDAQIVQATTEKSVLLRQVNKDEEIKLKLNIAPNIENETSKKVLNQNNKVTLTGIYMDEKGKENVIEKDVTLNLGWTGNFEVNNDVELVKYIPLNIQNMKKVFVQYKVKVGMKEADNKLPIKNTNIELQIPEFNNVKPNKIDVEAKSTMATNGKNEENIKFSTENWKYDRDNNNIIINIDNNEDENGKIQLGSGNDEYLITYIYPEDAFNSIKKEGTSLKTEINTKMTIYSNFEEKEFEQKDTKEITLTDPIGKLLSLDGESKIEKIGKGKMYANISSEDKLNLTEFETSWRINAGFIENLEQMQFTDEKQIALNPYGQQFDITPYTKYISTTINKDSFIKVLGNEGKIDVLNVKGEKVFTINNSTKVDDNGNYVVDYIGEESKLVFQTSKPVNEGNLIITNKKAITGKLPYAKTNIQDFANLEVTSSLAQKEVQQAKFLTTEEKQVLIPFENTASRAKLTINKDSLSSIVLNKDVEFKIELGNDSADSDLYMDPIFNIELPSYIQDIEIKSSEILYDNELIISNIEKLQNANGGITLRIQLNGVQTRFSNGTITNGTNIILNTDVKLNILTPNKTDEIKMYFYNLNNTNYENEVETENGKAGFCILPIAYSAPLGMLTVSNWNNYETTGRYTMSVNQGTLVDQIQVYQPTRISNMDLLLVNNTGNVCDNVSMLVRIPKIGNKTVLTGEELGTTIDTNLRSYITPQGIDANKFKIYYSENGNATKDLTNAENGWSEGINDITKIRSCLIVGEDYQMQPGELISFRYELELQANMTYNNNIMSNFAAYYTELSEGASLPQETQSDIVGLTTGKGPELNITQEVIGANENGKVNENGLLKYKITVINSGTESAKNVVVKDQVPKWASLVKSKTEKNTSATNVDYYIGTGETGQTMQEWNVVENGNQEKGTTPKLQWNIQEIKPGETIVKEFEVVTNQVPDTYTYYKDYPGFTIDEQGTPYISTQVFNVQTNTVEEKKNPLGDVQKVDIKNIATVTAGNFNAELKAEDESVTVDKSSLGVSESIMPNQERFKAGEELSYNITIINKVETDLKNVKFEKILPEGLIYKNTTIDSQISEEVNYDNDARKISGTIELLPKNTALIVQMNVTIDNLNEEQYEKTITTNTQVSADGIDSISSNDISIEIKKPQLVVTHNSNVDNQYLKAGEKVDYFLSIENVGAMTANGVKITYNVPKGLKFLSARYTINGLTQTTYMRNDGTIYLSKSIDPGEQLDLTISTQVEDVNEETVILCMAQISGEEIGLIVPDPITQTIEKSENATKPSNNNSQDNNKSNNQSNQSTTPVKEPENKLSGTVWIDADENGKRDNGEKLLPGITVIAIDTTTGTMAKTVSGNDARTTTDTNGNYLFQDLKEGNYIVEFIYDTKVYTTTKYQDAGAGGLFNSDAIERQITQEGKTILAGVTDTINLNKSTSNIDLGLIYKSKFDLKLDKTVTKIGVRNNEGSKVYTVENGKLAQVPISNRQLQNSVLAVEYSIKITNEGNVAGFAKSIIDYLPKELTFNSELNPNWYVGSDKKLYTTNLEKTVINPGESKEIKLILTQKLTSNSTGVINNTAEIKEAYNENGLKDKDSTPNNNAQGEDDISSADIIITIRTGGKYIAYGIGLIMALMIIAVLIFNLRKVNINFKHKKIFK